MNPKSPAKKPKHLRYTAGTRGGKLANGRALAPALTPKLAAAEARREPLSRAEEEAAADERDRAALARFFRTVLKK